MSVLPEPQTNQASPTGSLNPEQPGNIHLEPRFTPATDSQFLFVETALRLLAVWAVRAAEPAKQRETST